MSTPPAGILRALKPEQVEEARIKQMIESGEVTREEASEIMAEREATITRQPTKYIRPVYHTPPPTPTPTFEPVAPTVTGVVRAPETIERVEAKVVAAEQKLEELRTAYEEAPSEETLRPYRQYYEQVYRPTTGRRMELVEERRETEWQRFAGEMREAGLTQSEIAGIKANLRHIESLRISEEERERRWEEYMSQWEPVIAAPTTSTTEEIIITAKPQGATGK